MLTFRDTISDGEWIAVSQFTSTCGPAIMNFYDAGDEDNFYTRLMGFEQSCMDEADPMFFREAPLPSRCLFGFAALACRLCR